MKECNVFSDGLLPDPLGLLEMEGIGVGIGGKTHLQ